MTALKHIIISQIKNLGDVVLCLPTISLIKKYIPNCKVTLLAQSYTFDIAKNCPDIDALVSWTQLEKKTDSQIINEFRKLKPDAIIHLSINKKIAKCAFKAKIKNRIGTSQRWHHWLYCNKRINQARRHSALHELQLNAQMLNPLNIKSIAKTYEKQTLIELMNIQLPPIELPINIKSQLNNQKQQVILHPGSNGHGREWPMQHYIKLARLLHDNNYQVIFTGSAAEDSRFKTLIKACPFALNTCGQLSLEQLMKLINTCDLLLASGTGPVHISAALNKPTIGLFPPRKGISPRRWSPPGLKVSTLMHKRKKACMACRDSEGCLCMAKITVTQVKLAIEKQLKTTANAQSSSET